MKVKINKEIDSLASEITNDIVNKQNQVVAGEDVKEVVVEKNNGGTIDMNPKLKKILEELGEVAAEPVHDDKAAVEHTPEVTNDDVLPADEHKQAEDVKEVVVENVAGDTDLGEVAAEPVHDDKDAVEHTPEVTNNDVYTSDDHQQAEEVDEVLVESVASLNESDFNALVGSLNTDELSLLEGQFAAFISERDLLIEGIIRGSSFKDFKKLSKQDMAEIDADKYAKIQSINPSRRAATTAARQKAAENYAKTKEGLKAHIEKIKSSKPEVGTPEYDRRFELIAKARASDQAAKKAMNKERGFGIGNFRFGGAAAAREKERTKNLAADYKKEAELKKQQAKDSFTKAVADDKKTSLVSRAGAGLKKVGATINKLAGNTATPAAPKAAPVTASDNKDSNDYLKRFTPKVATATSPASKPAGVKAEVKKEPVAKKTVTAPKAATKSKKAVVAETYNVLQNMSNSQLRVLSEAVSVNKAEFEGKSYPEKFAMLLKKYGVSSPKALEGADKKEFFSTLNSIHTSKKEAAATTVKESFVLWSGKIKTSKVNEETKTDVVGNQFDVDAANKVGFNSAKEDTEEKIKDLKTENKAQPEDVTTTKPETVETSANAVTPEVTNDDLLKDSKHSEDVKEIVVEDVAGNTSLGDAAAEVVHTDAEPKAETPKVTNDDVLPADQHKQAEDVKEVIIEAEAPETAKIQGMNRADIGEQGDLFSGRIGRIIKGSLEKSLPRMSDIKPEERNMIVDLKGNAEFQVVIGKIKAQLDSSNPNYVMLQVLKRKAQGIVLNYTKQ
jgi:hypothetical protein